MNYGTPDARKGAIVIGPDPDALLYPVDALGEVLGPAARAIAAKVQCPLPMAGRSVLGVASLAAQGQADVMMPYGQTRPLSLFLVTISASGDRKTTSDREAMIPVRIREKKLSEQFRVFKEIYDYDHTGWQAQRTQIERAKMDVAERVAKLKALGPEPAAPLQPILTIGEATAEGLLKHMQELPGALGVCSAEGAQFLNGHGFSDDAKLRTSATFSTLWDGEPGEARSRRRG